MIPARGLLKVRPIETAEALPGSRILLPAAARDRLTVNQCEVIAVGAFAICDDPEECDAGQTHVMLDGATVHTHPVTPGAWILVAPRSYIDGPDPERKEWFVHQDAVLGIFNGEQA